MDELLKQQIQDKLTNANSITVCAAKSGGFDAFACGLALYLSIKKLGKNASVIAKTPTVADAQLIYGVDKIGNSEDKNNLVIVIGNAVKNVEKVTHFLEGDKLKLVIHAFGESNGVATSDISFERTSTKPDIIVAVGYDSQEALNADITQEQNIDSNVLIININNKQTSQKFAQIEINKEASYAEIVTSLLLDLALPLDEDIAFNLYAGLASSTKMFSPQIVSTSTFEIAQTLIKFGAGKANLAQKSMKKIETTQLQNEDSLVKNFDLDIKNIPQVPKDIDQKPIEDVEKETNTDESWLKPPKIYRGSKSFDSES